MVGNFIGKCSVYLTQVGLYSLVCLFVFPKVQKKGKRQMTQGYTQPHVIHTASFGRQSSVFISFLIHDLRVRFIAAVPESSKLPLAPETRNLKSAVLLSVNSVLATLLPTKWKCDHILQESYQQRSAYLCKKLLKMWTLV